MVERAVKTAGNIQEWRKAARAESRLRRRIVLLSSVLVASVGGSLIVPTVYAESAGNVYYAVAAADAFRATGELRGYAPVDKLFDLGAPTAQATIDSLGGPLGFAGFPWPGEDLLANAGFAEGSADIDLPDYPFAVKSSLAEPESDLDHGFMRLRTRSEENAAMASARGGVGDPGMSVATARSDATATRDPETGVMVAEASTAAEMIEIDSLLTIGVVESRANVTSAPDERPELKTALRVANVKIAGQSVGVNQNGVTVAGTDVELTRDHPLGAALEEAGISVRLIEAEETDDGIVAGGLHITVDRTLPESPEPLKVSLLFGRAAAHATGVQPSSLDFDDGFEMAPIGAEPQAPAVPGTSPGRSGVESESLDHVAPAPAAPGSDAGGASPRPDRTESAAPPTEISSIPAGRELPSMTSGAFYLVIVLGAVTAIGGGQLIRVFAVRLSWTS